MSGPRSDEEKSFVYLFSSQSRPLYAQNILDNLACPAGYLLHYRYERKYVSEAILRFETSGFRSLKNSSGLAVFVHQEQETSTSSLAIRGYYPLRTITVKDIRFDGPVLHVYFEVGNYVPYGHDSRDYYVGQLESLLGSDLPPDKYVALSSGEFKSDPDNQGSYTQAEAWISLIRQLNDLEPFKTSVFYRIAHLLDEQYNNPQKAKEILRRRSGYELASGRNYSLELSFCKLRALIVPH